MLTVLLRCQCWLIGTDGGIRLKESLPSACFDDDDVDDESCYYFGIHCKRRLYVTDSKYQNCFYTIEDLLEVTEG